MKYLYFVEKGGEGSHSVCRDRAGLWRDYGGAHRKPLQLWELGWAGRDDGSIPRLLAARWLRLRAGRWLMLGAGD